MIVLAAAIAGCSSSAEDTVAPGATNDTGAGDVVDLPHGNIDNARLPVVG